jgi:hypothetical protein
MPDSASDLMSDDELDAIMLTLEKAGLVEIYTRPDGRMACRLTDQGQRVGWMLAMHGDDADVVLSDLLEASAE